MKWTDVGWWAMCVLGWVFPMLYVASVLGWIAAALVGVGTFVVLVLLIAAFELALGRWSPLERATRKAIKDAERKRALR